MRLCITAFIAVLTLLVLTATAQTPPPPNQPPQAVPPFVGGPVTAFDVQVNVIESGALLDASAVVSQDRRYVTINAQPSNTSLLALQQFRTQTVQTIGSGYVGGVDPQNAAGVGKPSSFDSRSPTAILQAAKNNASVLNRRGVYLLGPLK